MHDTTLAAVLAALLFAGIAAVYVAVHAVAWRRRVRASDRRITAIGAGVRLPDEDTAAVLLAAWYADTRATELPELVDLDTAVRLARGPQSPDRR